MRLDSGLKSSNRSRVIGGLRLVVGYCTLVGSNLGLKGTNRGLVVSSLCLKGSNRFLRIGSRRLESSNGGRIGGSLLGIRIALRLCGLELRSERFHISGEGSADGLSLGGGGRVILTVALRRGLAGGRGGPQRVAKRRLFVAEARQICF